MVYLTGSLLDVLDVGSILAMENVSSNLVVNVGTAFLLIDHTDKSESTIAEGTACSHTRAMESLHPVILEGMACLLVMPIVEIRGLVYHVDADRTGKPVVGRRLSIGLPMSSEANVKKMCSDKL